MAKLHRDKERKPSSLSNQPRVSSFSLKLAWSGISLDEILPIFSVSFVGYSRLAGIEVRGGELKSTTEGILKCRDSCGSLDTCKAFEYRSGRRCYHYSQTSVCLTPFESQSGVHYRKTSTTCSKCNIICVRVVDSLLYIPFSVLRTHLSSFIMSLMQF